MTLLDHVSATQRLAAEVVGLATYAGFLLKLLPAVSLVLTVLLLTLSIAVRVQEYRINGRKLRRDDAR